MIADNALRLATAELVGTVNGVNGGASPGGLGPASVTLGLDESGLTESLRSFRDVGSGEHVSLAFSVDTAFTCAAFSSTIEFQLVSLPIAASLLGDATASGKRLRIALVATSNANDDLTVVGHGLSLGTPIHLASIATTTGIGPSRIYYVVPTGPDTFKLALSLANAIAGTTIALSAGDGTCTVNFIPTIHASSGSLDVFTDQGSGAPTDQGPLRAGVRFNVSMRSVATLTPKSYLRTGQAPLSLPRTGPALRTTAGAGPLSGLIGANAQRFFYLRYLPSDTMTAGAITCDLVMTSGNALNYQPTGTEMV